MYTLYERQCKSRQEQAFGSCLGKVMSVDSESRTCSIATAMGVGTMNDQFVDKCQWLSADLNPEGDESGVIPRVGSWCVVHFIDGEPFIAGFLGPLGADGSAKQGDKGPEMYEGDKGMSTVQGNRIMIKRSGLIELWAKDNLQRVMMPQGSAILDVCRSYTLQTDGGYIRWGALDSLIGTTLWSAEYAADLIRSTIYTEQKGFVDSTVIKKVMVGAGIPGIQEVTLPVYTEEISTSGSVTKTVTAPLPAGSPAGYSSTINPDGSISILAGLTQQVAISVSSEGSLSVENATAGVTVSSLGDITVYNPMASVEMANTGDVTVSNEAATIAFTSKGDLSLENQMAMATISAEGDIEISGPAGLLTISSSGDVALDGPKSVKISSEAMIDIKAGGSLNVESTGPVQIKANLVSIDGGSGTLEGVLTTPTTLSPFTGAPLMPGSQTVKVSI